MRIVKDNGADLDRRSSVPADTKLAAAGEQRLIGADEHALAIIKVAGERLSLSVGLRRDTVLTALGEDLADELVCRR